MRSSIAASAASSPGTRANAFPNPSGGRNSPRLRVSMRRKPAPERAIEVGGAVVPHRELLPLHVGDGGAAKAAQRAPRLGPRHEQRHLQRAEAGEDDRHEAAAPAQRPLEQQPQRRQRQLAVERREVREHAVDGPPARRPGGGDRPPPGPEELDGVGLARPPPASPAPPRSWRAPDRRRRRDGRARPATARLRRCRSRSPAAVAGAGKWRSTARNTRARIIAISGFAARREHVVVARRDGVERGRARGYSLGASIPISPLPARSLLAHPLDNHYFSC